MALGAPNSSLPGHTGGCQKDRVKQFTAALTGVRRHISTIGTVKQWIRLPREVVQYSSLNVFKTLLEQPVLISELTLALS